MAFEVSIGILFPKGKGAKGVGLVALCHKNFVNKGLNKGSHTHVASTLKYECVS